MPNTKRIRQTKNSCMFGSKHNIKECEVRLARDPLLITKTEIHENQSPTIMTLTASRHTAAEVFIEASSSSTVRKSKKADPKNIGLGTKSNRAKTNNRNENENNDESNESFGDDGYENHMVDESTADNQNNTDTGNGTLQDKYTCNICDDICLNMSEFKQHLEFHLELQKSSDKPAMVTDVVTLSSPENVPISDSSQQSHIAPNSMINETDHSSTSNSTKSVEIEASSFSENLLSAKRSQIKEHNSSASVSPIVGDTTKPIPIEESSTQNITAKSHSSTSTGKNSNPVLSQMPAYLKSLTDNQELPKIPIRECDCHLKKVATNCELCKKPPKFVCGNCKMEFNSYPKLKEHVTDAHKSARYFCQECGQGYASTVTLKRHIDRHRGLLPCYLCTSSFTEKYMLEAHIITHRIKCDQCDKICSHSKELSTHTSEVHKGITYNCEACNKTFKKYSLLRSHKIVHHREGEFKCRECDKVYKRLSSYNRHVHRHRQQKQVFCEQCGKEFQSTLNLKRHQNIIHLKKIKTYTCNVCEKIFNTSVGRNNCQNKHAGIAKYKCDMCDKAFFHGHSLLIHKRIHTGAKPYVCFICNRRFYSRQMLLKHCLSHSISEKEIKKRMKTAYQPEERK